MKNSNIRLFLILLCGVGCCVMEISRERKIVSVIVGIIRLIFYHLDLHQGFWCLRPVEYYYPLVEGAGNYLRVKELAGLVAPSWCVRRVPIVMVTA